jgi:hypothetical protein
MSENVTHTAVVDDCARLARVWDAICPEFKLALERHLDTARLGGITRAGDRHTPALLRHLRERRDELAGDETLRQKLAFTLGWLCHRAADRQMKPVFRAADPDCPRSPTDCSVYHDAFLLREVYGGGSENPYAEGLFDAASPREVEDLFRALLQRALVAMHTFIPDEDDVHAWLGRLFAARQRWHVDLDRYAEALAGPDPDRVRRFITDVNFYDAADPLIRMARSLQQGEAEASEDVEAALEAAAGQSQYALALRRGLLYLRAASDYFEGRLGDEELNDRLDIGRPGG